MSAIEKVETALNLQGGSKAAIEMSSEAVRECGTVMMLGVYGGRYNLFPLGNFFSRNVTLKMGQCPAIRYVEPIMNLIREGKFDATDIITHRLCLARGPEGMRSLTKSRRAASKWCSSHSQDVVKKYNSYYKMGICRFSQMSGGIVSRFHSRDGMLPPANILLNWLFELWTRNACS